MASKSSIEAGKGHVTLGTDDSALTKGLAAAQNKFQSWGRGITTMAAGIAAASGLKAITEYFARGVTVFQDWGLEMRSGMRETGIGFEQLEYLSHGLRTSVEELVPAVAKMSAFLHEAATGSATANATLRELGLSVYDLLGMSPGDRMQKIAEAIGAIGDANQRIALQRGIFGRGSLAMDVEGGAAGIRARAERREYLVGKPSEADQQMAASTGRLFEEMGAVIKAIWREIGAAAAPVMKEFYQIVISVLVPIREWITENRGLLTTIFMIADKVVLVGLAIGAIGALIYGASYAFSFLSGAIAITSSFLGALWGWTVFAASGFGILKVAAFAWAVVTAIASGIAQAAIWVYNAAVGVAHLLTYGLKVALIALGVAAVIVFGVMQTAFFAIPLALLAAVAVAVGVGAYFLGRWIATTAIFKAAWAAVVEFLSREWQRFRANAAVVIDFLAERWARYVEYFSSGFWAVVGPIADWFTGTLGPLMQSLGSTISTAFSGAWASASRAFAGIWDTVSTTFGYIMNAVRAGDWSSAWEILKTAGLLAWAQLTLFVNEQLIIWKWAAISVWNQIGDALADVFDSATNAIRIMFTRTWAAVVAGGYRAYAAIMEAAADAAAATGQDAAAALLRSEAGVARGRGLLAENTGANAAAAIQTAADSLAETIAEDRAARDALQTQVANAQFQGLDRSEIDRLQWALLLLNDGIADAAAATAATPAAASAYQIGAGQAMAAGTYSAAAARGWYGASGGLTNEQQARTQRGQMVALLQRVADRLDAMAGPAFA